MTKEEIKKTLLIALRHNQEGNHNIANHAIESAIAQLEELATASDHQSRAGSATSEAKAAAVRENGKKGGRPKKAPKTED